MSAPTQEAVAVDSTAPEIEQAPHSPLPRLSRRTLLRRSAALAAGGSLAVAAGPKPALAQDPGLPDETGGPAMRSEARAFVASVAAGLAGEPALPTPEIIALNRMGFGPRPGDLAALLALGANSEERLNAYIDQQLNPAAIDDSDCDARIAAQGFTTLGKSLTQLWKDHTIKEGIDWNERIRPANETVQATFLRAIYSKRQLVEVLADFWHNHFNVYGWDSWSASTWVHYDRDVIRANQLGNFRKMLGAVAKSPAMLYYLDNVSNTSAGPNENWAREMFEIHTMGAENYLGVASTVGPNNEYRHPAPVDDNGMPLLYVDDDVYGTTQCFTGWRVNKETGAFVFEDTAHANYPKMVLARNMGNGGGQADGETVLDLVANHPGTARAVCRSLCRRLIADEPPESIVLAAAAVFHAQRNAPDQLKQVVRIILRSSEFRSAWGQKIKRPYEFTVSVLRATRADFAWSDSFRWRFENMAQMLFSWRPPDGYPDKKEAWSSTMPMLQRWRMCNYLTDGWTYGGDGANKDNLRINCRAQMPDSVNTSEAIVDFWAKRMLGYLLPAAERMPIVTFMAAGKNPQSELPAADIDERLRFAVDLILMAPSFQWR